MKKLFRPLVLAMALAISATALAPVPSHASSSTVVASSGLGHHVWVVAGLGIAVGSIIACSMIVGAEEGRELTLDEAVHAGVFPLHCLWRYHLVP
jgi:hypothetical protein